MTRKDFYLIARTIAAADLNPADRRRLAEQFADSLRQTNPRFDAGRFILAATNTNAAPGAMQN